MKVPAAAAVNLRIQVFLFRPGRSFELAAGKKGQTQKGDKISPISPDV